MKKIILLTLVLGIFLGYQLKTKTTFIAYSCRVQDQRSGIGFNTISRLDEGLICVDENLKPRSVVITVLDIGARIRLAKVAYFNWIPDSWVGNQ